MKVIEVESRQKNLWDDFVRKNGTLLQSWAWGDLKETVGFKPHRFVVIDDNKWLLVCSVLKKELPLKKSFLYAPEGPVLDKKIQISKSKFQKYLKTLLQKIGDIAHKEKAIFFRVEPMFETKDLEKFGFIKSFEDIQPRYRLWLNLSKPEEEILAQMKHKGRYNIKLAKKRGVTIQTSSDDNMLDAFYKLYVESARRDRFSFRPKKYFENLFKVLLLKNFLLFLAFYRKAPIAATLISFWGKYATYLYGGSSNDYRNIMAPYLIQWEAIKEAKKRGCLVYDFGAISREDKEHRFAGLRQFKTRFGGEEKILLGCYDFIYNKLGYNTFKFIEKFRRKS